MEWGSTGDDWDWDRWRRGHGTRRTARVGPRVARARRVRGGADVLSEEAVERIWPHLVEVAACERAAGIDQNPMGGRAGKSAGLRAVDEGCRVRRTGRPPGRDGHDRSPARSELPAFQPDGQHHWPRWSPHGPALRPGLRPAAVAATLPDGRQPDVDARRLHRGQRRNSCRLPFGQRIHYRLSGKLPRNRRRRPLRVTILVAAPCEMQHYQASSETSSWNVPVGPSSPIVAMRTMTSAPFSTGCPAPLKGVRSVAVKPGSTALNLICGSALAY